MSDPVFSLANRVALVTGGSRGIGQAIAATLARQGADVAICSRHVAEAVVYLTSDEAGMVNGSVLSVDGGWTAW